MVNGIAHPEIKGVFTPGKSTSSLALVWTKYIFGHYLFWFVVVRLHTVLFVSEPETVNKTTCVFKVTHTLVHPFNRTRVSNCTPVRTKQPYRDPAEEVVSVWLFGPHRSTIAVFKPAQKIRSKGENELEFDSIGPNKTGVNTPRFAINLTSGQI